MGRGYYDILRPILMAHGCEWVRQGKGSHEIWKSSINGRHFTVPVTVESRFTAQAILKQAGIKESI